MTGEEEDALLEDPGNLTEDKTLLSLRQKYKKTRTNIARVSSHLAFISKCENEEKIPKGLQVNVKCNALLADLSNIKQEFATTKGTAEHDFSSSLLGHYRIVKGKLESELKTLEETIAAKLENVDPGTRKTHEDLMTKTVENITKHQQRLEERKKRKMDYLTNQDSRRPTYRRHERGQERGMPYHNPNPPPRYNRQPNQATRPARQPQLQPTGIEMQPVATGSTQLPQASPANLAQEVAEMRTLLNRLLINRPPPIQQPPSLLGMQNCTPMQQPHSLLGVRGQISTGQHPSLSGRDQQFFM